MKLEVGEVIYSDHAGKLTGKHRVYRVTETQAILSNGVKLKREYSSERYSSHAIGASGLRVTWYRHGNPELDATWEMQVLHSELEKAIPTLTLDQLRAIHKILNTQNQ